MNISRINFLSQFVVPLVQQKPIVLKKEQEYLKVTEVTSKDNNMKRKEEHDAMYYYELYKNQPHREIKDVSEEYKHI